MCHLTANIQALMQLVKNNENSKDFDLTHWTSDCGTFGCLVGNDLLARNVFISEAILQDILWGKRHDHYYGLQHSVFNWLFNCRKKDHENNWKLRNNKDKKAALNRVRKAIYYILRKRELMYDDDGEFSQEKYEEARRTGDIGISDKVLEEVRS